MDHLAFAGLDHVGPFEAVRIGHLHPTDTCSNAREQGQPDLAVEGRAVRHRGDEHAQAFEALAVADAAVQQCWRVTSGPDFVLVLWVRDMADYQALVERLFTQHANVRTVKTFFATRRAKFDPRVPAAALVRGSNVR